MKTLQSLEINDYIAFEWEYGPLGKEIIVDKVSSIHGNKVLVHFLYGLRGEAEYVDLDKIIAIGDPSANGKIKGWSGNFNILIPTHELLKNE